MNKFGLVAFTTFSLGVISSVVLLGNALKASDARKQEERKRIEEENEFKELLNSSPTYTQFITRYTNKLIDSEDPNLLYQSYALEYLYHWNIYTLDQVKFMSEDVFNLNKYSAFVRARFNVDYDKVFTEVLTSLVQAARDYRKKCHFYNTLIEASVWEVIIPTIKEKLVDTINQQDYTQFINYLQIYLATLKEWSNYLYEDQRKYYNIIMSTEDPTTLKGIDKSLYLLIGTHIKEIQEVFSTCDLLQSSYTTT